MMLPLVHGIRIKIAYTIAAVASVAALWLVITILTDTSEFWSCTHKFSIKTFTFTLWCYRVEEEMNEHFEGREQNWSPFQWLLKNNDALLSFNENHVQFLRSHFTLFSVYLLWLLKWNAERSFGAKQQQN